jgi:hypothetical protein
MMSDRLTVVAASRNGHVPEPEDAGLQPFFCHGCQRRLFWYTSEPLAAGKRLRFRCRDCKAWSVLEGPQVIGALREAMGGSTE